MTLNVNAKKNIPNSRHAYFSLHEYDILFIGSFFLLAVLYFYTFYYLTVCFQELHKNLLLKQRLKKTLTVCNHSITHSKVWPLFWLNFSSQIFINHGICCCFMIWVWVNYWNCELGLMEILFLLGNLVSNLERRVNYLIWICLMIFCVFDFMDS